MFAVGDKVIAVSNGSYNWLLTEGKEYTVVKYEPPHRDPTFTWPAYVTVLGDHGKPVTGHAHRFKHKEILCSR